MLVNDMNRPVEAIPVLNQLLKVKLCVHHGNQ